MLTVSNKRKQVIIFDQNLSNISALDPPINLLGYSIESSTSSQSNSTQLEWRWHPINGEETLQVKNFLKPSSSSFADMDTSNWATVYGFSGDPLSYNLNDTNWPDAAVSNDYILEHGTNSSFDGLTVQYGGIENDSDQGNYRQLAIDPSEVTGVNWSDNATTTTNVLFLYAGDLGDENSANGKSSSWPTIVRTQISTNLALYYEIDDETVAKIMITEENQLRSHWKFDESRYAEAKDEIKQNSGTLIDLNTAGINPAWVSGKFSNALSFDGDKGRVNFGPLQLDENFSFSLWVKPDLNATQLPEMTILSSL